LVSQEDPLDKGRFLKVPADLNATTFSMAEGLHGSFGRLSAEASPACCSAPAHYDPHAYTWQPPRHGSAPEAPLNRGKARVCQETLTKLLYFPEALVKEPLQKPLLA
jgi:hypothetical protein